ncbi:MAG: mechanosensitive ion channel [Caldilineaceae bacterium]
MAAIILHLQEIVDQLLIFIRRPQVEEQLLTLLAIFALAALLTNLAWRFTYDGMRRFLSGPTRVRWPWRLLRFGLAALKALTFPIVGLILTNRAIDLLTSWGQLTGLLSQMERIFYTIIAFNLLTTLLYSYLDAKQTRRYHYRLLLPLLICITFFQGLNHMIDVRELASIVILRLFDSPISLGALFVATFGLYFWTDMANALHTFVLNLITRHTDAEEGSVQAALTLVHYGLIIAGCFFALSQLQLDPTTIAAITGGLSVGIGFGLREVLSNFISGILLLFENSLRPGDVIAVDNEMGVVQQLSIRAAKVRTLDNVELVIPNQTFLTSSFKTFTGSDKMIRVSLLIRTSYEVDIQEIIRMLQQTAAAHPKVLSQPAPDVWVQEAFGDNVIDYKVVMYINSPMLIESIKSDVTQAIWREFRQHNINLTFPDMELHFNDSLPKHLPRPGAPVEKENGHRALNSAVS